MADYQKNRVYRWEASLPPGQRVDLETADALVRHIWSEMGRVCPQKVEPLPKTTTRFVGDANRYRIRLQPTVSTKTVIHEVAHSMNATVDHVGDGHGPDFVGIYIRLLDRFGVCGLPQLMYTLTKDRIDFNLFAPMRAK